MFANEPDPTWVSSANQNNFSLAYNQSVICSSCKCTPRSQSLNKSSAPTIYLTLILNEQQAIVFPSAKKSQLTTAPLNPKHASAPRINPHGNASILIAPTLALSSSGGRRRSHFSSRSLRTNTPRWLVWSLSICLRNTSVQNSDHVLVHC